MHDGLAQHPYLLELRERMALEQPGSRVQDVPAKGDCFFLSANIGLQALQRAPRTKGDDELEEAGWRDRAAVTGRRRARLPSHPLIDGDELQIKLALCTFRRCATRLCDCVRGNARQRSLRACRDSVSALFHLPVYDFPRCRCYRAVSGAVSFVRRDV